MDPQLKSVISSVLGGGAAMITTWAVAHGVLPADQGSTLTTALTTVLGAVVFGLITWWKARQHTQTNLIKEVNQADNGVKVVAATTPAPVVDQPLKGK